MLVLVLAYLLTGFMCIVWDFRKPFIDRPHYAINSSRYLKGFITIILGWLPLKTLIAVSSGIRSEALKPLVTFAILWVGGSYLFG